MATVFSTNQMNLQQAFNREAYEGYELLLAGMTQANDLFTTAAVLPSNNGVLHKTLVVDKLPEGKVRNANQGIVNMTGNTHLKEEPLVYFEGKSDVDEGVIDGSPDPVATRQSEDAICLEGFSQSYNKLLLKGTASKDGGFEGFEARRGTLSDYCVSLGGTGTALSSAYLIEMGETGFSLRYIPTVGPGLIFDDFGRRMKADPNGLEYPVWTTMYKIAYGISLRQDKALMRLCNIDALNITANKLLKTVIQQKNKLPHAGRNAFLYVNSDVQSALEIATIESSKNLRTIEIENYGPVLHYLNLPIMRMDALSNTESAIA